MDLALDDERTGKFVTNVGLITSDGPYGSNIMAAEWTHHVSYAPSLIATCIRPRDATYANVMETKEFGVNLCAFDQSVISSISGGKTGKVVDKIKVLKELGIEFHPAQNINVLMVKGAAMSAECKLFKTIELGDHTMFVGEVVHISITGKKPLVYHDGEYWILCESLQKP